MKKILLIFTILLLLMGGLMIIHSLNSEIELENKSAIENELVPENALKFTMLLNDEKILMTKEEIRTFNEKIKQETNSYYDLSGLTSFTKEEILNYINSYQLPDLPKYENDIVYTEKDTEEIINNLNIDNVKDTQGIRGIIIKRANLRSFPTNKRFYDDKAKQKFDALQESELLVNTPVMIIHESKDKLWSFVISPFYAGWVENSNIALAVIEDWQYFLNNDHFIVITAKEVDASGTILDMSVTLPYEKEREEDYEVILPTKDETGNITRKKIILSKDVAHKGFLDYNNRNLLLQAFKYEGTEYSWGGLDKNVDCSGFVANVYRCFGFYFPRNTSSQKENVGKRLLVKDKSLSEKRQLLEENTPALIYRPGHVMLYLGKIDDKYYIIHASGQYLAVVLTEIDDETLTNIDTIVII